MLLANALLLSQAQAQTVVKKESFAVASVKQNKSDEKASSNVPLTVGRSFAGTGGTLHARNQPLFVYILFAYKIHVNEAWDLLNRLPKWAVADRFDIEAKTDEHDPSKDQIRSMMQSLLEERFSLLSHREDRESAVLGLRLAKSGKLGPLLRHHASNRLCSSETDASSHPLSVMTVPLQELLGVWPESCDVEEAGSFERMRAGARDISMPEMAGWLTGEGDTELPIVDRTGLTGNFDVVFEFAPEHGPDTRIDQSVPTFKEALQDQLGLKLEKQRGVATFFVVDHIEHLIDN
jgi:uncharacterized protein (TIGR03435 family)